MLMTDHALIIWLAIITTTGFIYLVSDGGALGMSFLMLFLDHEHKVSQLRSLLPVWDMNQTWLVFTLSGLYGGFSLGFSVLMQMLYVPALLLLLAFILRGAALEYAAKTHSSVWLFLLSIASLFIMLLQAVVIFVLWQSVVHQSQHTLAFWITQSVFAGLTFICYELLLGMQYLATEKIAHITPALLLVFAAIYSMFIMWLQPLVPLRYLVIAAFGLLMSYALHKKSFYFALKGFGFANVVATLLLIFPHVFPGGMSYVHATTNPESVMILVGISVIMLPALYFGTQAVKHYFRDEV